MRKRKASLYPSVERPALPVLSARSRVLVRPNCRVVLSPPASGASITGCKN
jgi:hypothetical protein